MEDYCRRVFNVPRIWLDVYDDNEVGKHIYQKLGYSQFQSEILSGRTLHFFR